MVYWGEDANAGPSFCVRVRPLACPGIALLSRVLGTIAEHQLLSRGDQVLVAVSGGPDSLALLHALVRLGPRLGLGLQVATVDHGLRPESAAEAAEVARRCAQLGLPSHVLRVDVGAQKRAHVSLQDAARRARLASLTGWAAQRGCTRIALGHTADDQAETILFRIVRGTGVDGLVGIPYKRGLFVRPLLDVRRQQVLAFLRRRKVDFLSDPSNRDPRFARSRVRHDWLPYLARENPRVAEALLALARSALSVRERLGASSTGSLPPDVVGAPALGRRAAQVVRRLVAQGQGSREVAIAGGVIDVTYGRATFRAHPAPAQAGSTDAAPTDAAAKVVQALVVQGPGIFLWPPAASEPTFELEIGFRTGSDGPARGAATFDAEIFSRGLVLRSLRPGDRMRPRGGRGRRKLQDLLVDAKVPRKQRSALPLLVTGDEVVLFVPGLRPAEEARPPPEARRWVEIRVR
jgi:tRNA(Ile)-lysidine synthase